ncbi:class I SAM-dependent methyltransferase [Gammaproteobacteria bacterium]|nr:class I SAM-dependent methyltransferase [Gammaproteobacteria bacterium]
MKILIKKTLGFYWFARLKFFIKGILSLPKLSKGYLNYLDKKFDSDKDFHGYLDFYKKFFKPLRFRKLKILEIGIGGHLEENHISGSLLMWASYFPRSKIYGIDLSSKPLFNRLSRVSTHVVDQSSAQQLQEYISKHGPFDIIIDDGSHFTTHIHLTFDIFYPSLNFGGLYIIEDMGATYIKSFDGEPDFYKNSNFFLRMMEAAKMTSRRSYADSFQKEKEIFSKLHSITFGNQIIIVENSQDVNQSSQYEHDVDPNLTRDELRDVGGWVISKDADGVPTQKLDSGQMG